MKNRKVFQKIEELTLRDPKNLLERSLKTCEEAGELAAAVLSESLGDYKKKTKHDILLEAADVVMCGVSVILEAGFSLEHLDEALAYKSDKWEKILDEKE